MGQLGDGLGIEAGLGDVDQRLEHLVGHSVAPHALQVERQVGVLVHRVGLGRVDEELEHDAVGEDAQLGGGDGIVMGAQLVAGIGQIGADLLAFDGDHRLPVAQDGEIDLVGLVGIGGVLRIDFVRIGVVITEQAENRQHEVELGAFLVAAGAHQADGPLGNGNQAGPQLVLGVHRCIPPPLALDGRRIEFSATNLEHGPGLIRRPALRTAVDGVHERYAVAAWAAGGPTWRAIGVCFCARVLLRWSWCYRDGVLGRRLLASFICLFPYIGYWFY